MDDGQNNSNLLGTADGQNNKQGSNQTNQSKDERKAQNEKRPWDFLSTTPLIGTSKGKEKYTIETQKQKHCCFCFGFIV